MTASLVGPVSEARLGPLVGDLRQLASVRRFTLQEGAEDGVRGLAFDTGGGLAFWVLDGRGLDIATLSWRGLPCAWQGPGGLRHPGLHEREGEGGRGFARSFSGFMVTCGLDHTRQPAGGQPLHGRLPFTPARLTGHGEVWDTAEPYLFAEGQVVQAAAGGESWLLRRRIEAPIGGAAVRITDRVTNRTATARQQPILYHLNLGFPLLRQGSRALLDGVPIIEPFEGTEVGRPAEVTCRRAGPGAWSRCALRSPASEEAPAVTLTVAFATDTLPWLQLWTDLAPGMHVLGIEPCNTDRAADGRTIAAASAELGAYQTRSYQLEIELAGG